MKFNPLICLSISLLVSGLAAEDIKDAFESPNLSKVREIIANANPPISSTPSKTVDGRITNGALASIAQFPYQVYLRINSTDGNRYLCGGSVINETWILTAAHCIESAYYVEVYFGAINRYEDGRFGSHTKMIAVSDLESIIYHPYYDNETLLNDIGLLHLPEAAPIDGCLTEVIKIPKIGMVCDLVGEIATVSGFGIYSDAEKKTSMDLNFIQRPIIFTEFCAIVYGWPVGNDAVICMDTSNKQSSCPGDSGGPVTISDEEGNPIQVGIVSYGHKDGCELGYPVGFTRISSHIIWLEGVTGLDFSGYSAAIGQTIQQL